MQRNLNYTRLRLIPLQFDAGKLLRWSVAKAGVNMVFIQASIRFAYQILNTFGGRESLLLLDFCVPKLSVHIVACLLATACLCPRFSPSNLPILKLQKDSAWLGQDKDKEAEFDCNQSWRWSQITREDDNWSTSNLRIIHKRTGGNKKWVWGWEVADHLVENGALEGQEE